MDASVSQLLQLSGLVAAIALAPGLLAIVTAFTRIAIVLSLLRAAIGVPGILPGAAMAGLALVLTWFVMEPAVDAAWREGIGPMLENRIGQAEGFARAAEPFRQFMLANARPADIGLMADLARLPPPADAASTPWRALVPAFLLGELRRAFEIGVYLLLPFAVIDLVVASVLMGLGLVMLPPNAIALPVKLLFFVQVDGWALVAGGLVQGFN
jgi:flagellar biosynthetic protein FliP